MNLRRCTPCQGFFPLAAFAWRRVERGYRDTFCYRCRATYRRDHYAANRERYIRMAGDRRDREVERRTRLLIAYLERHPCADCGEDDPLVLEFDHVGDKRFGISRGLRDRPWADVLSEMDACEVVCANCHRRRTYARADVLRLRLSADDRATEARASYATMPASLPALAGVAQW